MFDPSNRYQVHLFRHVLNGRRIHSVAWCGERSYVVGVRMVCDRADVTCMACLRANDPTAAPLVAQHA